MKIRMGFVSNSSTSSFYCPICSEMYNLMDGDSTSDPYDLYTCVNYHGFCIEHANISDNELLAAKIEILKDWGQFNTDFNMDLENFSLSDFKELLAENEDGKIIDERLYYFKGHFNTHLPEGLCPICTFDVVTDNDLRDYLLTDINKNEIRNKIKEKFSSYKDFAAFLRAKNKQF
jgi:hypothetical protein